MTSPKPPILLSAIASKKNREIRRVFKAFSINPLDVLDLSRLNVFDRYRAIPIVISPQHLDIRLRDDGIWVVFLILNLILLVPFEHVQHELFENLGRSK